VRDWSSALSLCALVHPCAWFTNLEKEEGMLRLRTWAFRYALLAAFVLSAGAGFKWN
jgi:hypothetical protein